MLRYRLENESFTTRTPSPVSRYQAAREYLEEPIGGSPMVPPPPPPPPPASSGHVTPALLQSGRGSGASTRNAILEYSTKQTTYGSQPGLDYPNLRYGSAQQLASPNTASLPSCDPSPRSDVGRGYHGLSNGPRPQRPKSVLLDQSSSRGEVRTPTVDTDLALSLVNETRDSFEVKTAGLVPFSEKHLTSLIHLDSLPSLKPTNVKPVESAVNRPVSVPLSVDTAWSPRPASRPSPAAKQFDPDSLMKELQDSVYKRPPSGPNSRASSPFRFQPYYSPGANKGHPEPPNRLYTNPINDDIDSLTDKLLNNMATGRGAAGNYMCAKCNEAISGDKPGCTALNSTYHTDCFVCTVCGNLLAGGSFYAVDGKPYCEKDYIATLDKCAVCDQPIMDRILRASGKAYHPACFVCTSCKKTLDGVPFTVDSNNLIHCVPCFHEKYAPRCAICSRPIVPEEGKQDSLRVIAMDKSFHVDCYKCEDCGLKLSSQIEGHECYPLDDHLLCRNCNGERVRKLTAAAR